MIFFFLSFSLMSKPTHSTKNSIHLLYDWISSYARHHFRDDPNRKYVISNGWENAFDDGVDNQWDNGAIGNYWSDYSGKDTNDDGIGDTPYTIPEAEISQV